jgi:CYTH domain-containing protein
MQTTMSAEIERKFLVTTMPDLTGQEPIRYERYYLNRSDNVEERIQKKGDTYEYEKKEKVSDLEHKKETRSITQEEFESLRAGTSDAIIRDSFKVSNNPDITIKVYHGKYEGLIRAEVEFDSLESAEAFIPSEWMGKEITGTPLGKDSGLLDLSEEQFKEMLHS